MKKLLAILLIITSINIALAQEGESKKLKKVLISQLVEHPALNTTTQGIIDGIEQSGYKRGVNLSVRVESAQANPALAAQIAAKFINQQPDLVVGVGTMTAQSFAKYTNENKIKMIFSSVTDPLQAGIVSSLEKPGNNISGVSNFVALEPQIALFQQLQPSIKKLGILYNPGEVNSVSIVKKLKAACLKNNVILITQTANKTAEVAQSATKLAYNVDAIFISNDNTALSALQSIIMAANNRRIPVYVSDTDAVALGALAALGPNQYDVGIQTGKMIARSFNGEEIATIPVEFPKKMDLYLNAKVAQMLGILLPDALKAKAVQVLE